MQLRSRHLIFAGLGGLAMGLALATSIVASDRTPPETPGIETPGIEQEFLLNSPLAQFPGKRIVVFTGEFQPGASTPLHRHPGTELLFVLAGEGTMAIPGREPLDLTPGNIVLVEPSPGDESFTHQAINLSATEGMKTLVIVIHDEGTPPALPLKEMHK